MISIQSRLVWQLTDLVEDGAIIVIEHSVAINHQVGKSLLASTFLKSWGKKIQNKSTRINKLAIT